MPISWRTITLLRNHKELWVLLEPEHAEKLSFVGSDQWTDLAEIRIANTNVTTVAEFRESQMMLKLGKRHIAIGSPLGSEISAYV